MTEHLQINDVAPCVHYLADGVQAAFVFPFAVFKAFDLEVWLDGGQVCSGFSVSGVGISSGGAVLFAVPPAAATRVTLRRRLALERTTDFQADGIIRAKTLNDELDYQVAAVQQVADDLSRCVRRPFTSASAADLSLPDPSPGKALGWSADGAALVNDPADFAATLASVTAQASQVSQGAAAAAASGAAAQVASTAAQAAAQQAQAAVGGVRVSATDSTARPLTESLIAGDHLAVTVQNGGGDESLRLDVTGLGGLAVKDSLTPADLVGVASGTLLGRASTGNGGAEAISLGSSLRLVGGVLDCTSGTDILARDQIALTNLRLLLNSAVSSGALFQGMQWELASDEWAAGSSGYAFNSSSPNYYGNIGFPVAVPGGTGSLIGNTNNADSSAAAFDGNSSTGAGRYDGYTEWTDHVSSPAPGGSYANTLTIGKDWGAGVTKSIARFDCSAGSNAGNGTAAVNIYLQGSNDNSTWVTLSTTKTITTANGLVSWAGADVPNVTAYRYHRAVIGGPATTAVVTVYCWTLTFYVPSTPPNMTVISPAVPVSSAPNAMDVYLLWKDDSGSAVLGSDLTVELSRNGGTTFTAATLSQVASFDGTYSVVKARADVSAQPSGTSMKARIKTLNNKAQRIAAPALYKE